MVRPAGHDDRDRYRLRAEDSAPTDTAAVAADDVTVDSAGAFDTQVIASDFNDFLRVMNPDAVMSPRQLAGFLGGPGPLDEAQGLRELDRAVSKWLGGGAGGGVDTAAFERFAEEAGANPDLARYLADYFSGAAAQERADWAEYAKHQPIVVGDPHLGGMDPDARIRTLEATAGRFAVAAYVGAAPTTELERRAQTTVEGLNLPTDPTQRRAIEQIESGAISIDRLSRNEAGAAVELMKAYPPPAGPMGATRRDATTELVARLERLDRLYADNGWTRDSEIQPGTPASDQALVFDIVDRAAARGAENGRDGLALTTEDFGAIGFADTLKGIQAIENIRASNPAVFGDPPPTDPGMLATRERIDAVDRHLRRNADIQALTTQVDGLSHGFDRLLEERGVVGYFSDETKNTVGRSGGWIIDSDLGSDAVLSSIADVAKARSSLDDMRSFEGSDEAFIEEMAVRKQALVDALEAATTHVGAWSDSQSVWLDGVSDMAAVTAGVAAAAAAPLTGGGSLVLAGAVGAGTKVLVKGVDAATGSGIYDGNVLGDLGKGFFAGASGAGTAQLTKVMGTRLAARWGGGTAAKVGGFVLAEGAGGALDGFGVGTTSTLIDGGSVDEALANGLRGGAIGLVMGPLVGGGMSGAGRLVKAVREGAPLPRRVPASAATDVMAAQLERAGVNVADLGPVHIKELEPGANPYARRTDSGELEMGLPVQRDGTVLANDLGHEVEHLRQFAAAKTDPKMAADIEAAADAAADVHRLRRELRDAGPGHHEALEIELDAAQRRYSNNPVEVAARAAGEEAEAAALTAEGKHFAAFMARHRAWRLRRRVPSEATTPQPRPRDGELRMFSIDEQAEAVLGEVRDAGTVGDVLAAKSLWPSKVDEAAFTRAAADRIDAVVRATDDLAELDEAMKAIGDLGLDAAGRARVTDAVQTRAREIAGDVERAIADAPKRRSSGNFAAVDQPAVDAINARSKKLVEVAERAGLKEADLFGPAPGFNPRHPILAKVYPTAPATSFVEGGAAANNATRKITEVNPPQAWVLDNGGDFINKGPHWHVRHSDVKKDLEVQLLGAKRNSDGGIDLQFEVLSAEGGKTASSSEKNAAIYAVADMLEKDPAFRARARELLPDAIGTLPEDTTVRRGAVAVLHYLDDLAGYPRTEIPGVTDID